MRYAPSGTLFWIELGRSGMRKEGGHGERLSYYDFGATTVYAARGDQRFAYCAYVPEEYGEGEERRYPLAVLVHGTGRGMLRCRDAFAQFAEREKAILLCPLFPANICFPGDLSSYKLLKPTGCATTPFCSAWWTRWRRSTACSATGC